MKDYKELNLAKMVEVRTEKSNTWKTNAEPTGSSLGQVESETLTSIKNVQIRKEK